LAKNKDFANAQKTHPNPNINHYKELARRVRFLRLQGCAAVMAVALPKRQSIASVASELYPALTAIPPTHLLCVTADKASILRFRWNQ